jgi:hypothetical protein
MYLNEGQLLIANAHMLHCTGTCCCSDLLPCTGLMSAVWRRVAARCSWPCVGCCMLVVLCASAGTAMKTVDKLKPRSQRRPGLIPAGFRLRRLRSANDGVRALNEVGRTAQPRLHIPACWNHQNINTLNGRWSAASTCGGPGKTLSWSRRTGLNLQKHLVNLLLEIHRKR